MASVRSRVTQTELARRLGVSQGAVNRALSGQGGISEVLAQQICELAESLGYRPNFGARTLRDGRSNVIALVVSGLGHGGFAPSFLVGGIEQELVKAGKKLHLTDLPGGELMDRVDLSRLLKELIADGLIVNYMSTLPRAAEFASLAEHYRLPVVWTNDKRPHDVVYPDEVAASVTATESLLSMGHRRIAFFRMAEPVHFSTTDRYLGYDHAMRSAAASPRLIAPDPAHSLHDTIGTMQALLRAADRPTAVVTYELRETNVLLFAAMQAGLKVPQDLSIVTFSDVPPLRLGLPIRSVQTPFVEIGRQAVRMLEQKILSGQRIPAVAVRFSIVHLGESCLPPRP